MMNELILWVFSGVGAVIIFLLSVLIVVMQKVPFIDAAGNAGNRTEEP